VIKGEVAGEEQKGTGVVDKIMSGRGCEDMKRDMIAIK
jgi:hypothetical protein